MLTTLAKSQKPSGSIRDFFLSAVAAVQLSQRLFSGAAGQIPDFHSQVSAMLARMADLKWNHVNFPVANVLLSQTYADIFAQHHVKDSERNQILLESLFTFLNILADNPEYATESVLRSIVYDAALSKTKAATPVELNYRANILKIFTPNNVAAIDLEPLQIVVYRGELIGGGFGPELWGLAYAPAGPDKIAHLLLETGEYLKVPEPSLCLAMAKDYSTAEVPPYLLACSRIFFPAFLHSLHKGAEKELVLKLEKNLGTFTANYSTMSVSPNALADCDSVLDKARWSSDHAGTEGVIKTFNFDAEQLQVVISAQQAAIRPYITSMLVNAASGGILMRLDVPREFSAYGVYLFPAGSASAALISYPTV